MTSKLLSLLALLCAIQICLAALAFEIAPVTDPKLKAQGYTCQNDELGPMKDREENDNYNSKICGKVSCGNGEFTYETCSSYSVPKGMKKPKIDPTKPFPACCNYPF